MFDQEIINQQLTLLATHRRTLRALLQQQALLGGTVYSSPGVMNSIAEARLNISRIKAYLRENSVQVADEPNDDTLSGMERSNQTELLVNPPFNSLPSHTLPSGSRMPYWQNPFFVGHEQDLHHLIALLQENSSASSNQIVAVTGLGGIGKTQFIIEFVYRYGQIFTGGVFWLSFADPTNISSEIASCGGFEGMNLPNLEELKLEHKVHRVLEEWRKHRPLLIIIDNCEDETLLLKWKRLLGNDCRILLTSRRSHWSEPLVKSIALNVLSRKESVILLQKYRSDLEIEDPRLETIASEIGDLPLALHLAGSFLATYSSDPKLGNPAYFVDQLRSNKLIQHPAFQGEGAAFSPTDHLLHVAGTFMISYEQLKYTDDIDTLARELLARASYFAPGEPIPAAILLNTVGQAENNSGRDLQLARAFVRLTNLGLLQEGLNHTLILHKMLVAFLQDLKSDTAAQSETEHAMLVYMADLNRKSLLASSLMQTHMRHLRKTLEMRDDIRAATLYNEIGCQMGMLGDYSEGSAVLKCAWEILLLEYGSEHFTTIQVLNNYAALLHEQGDDAGAFPLYKQALESRERLCGSYHPSTAESLHNLAQWYYRQGQFTNARSLAERAKDILERALGIDHNDTLLSIDSFASLLAAQGDYETAKAYYLQVLKTRLRKLAPNHSHIGYSLHNLASVYAHQGRFREAEIFIRKALDILTNNLGSRHSMVHHLQAQYEQIQNQIGQSA